MTSAPHFLGIAGLLLFAIGLFVGFAIPRLRNARMALSAHLTAVQTGPALIAIALFWSNCSVPGSWDWPLASVLAVSSYTLVAGIGIAAASGASKALPLAGEGFHGSAFQEKLVSVVVITSSVAMTGAIVPLCWFAVHGALAQ